MKYYLLILLIMDLLQNFVSVQFPLPLSGTSLFGGQMNLEYFSAKMKAW